MVLNSLGFVLARAGSKRLPNKNITPLQSNKDIVELAIEKCVANGIRVVLSTDILKHMQEFHDRSGVLLVPRPEHLCGDAVDPVDVILDVLQSFIELPEYIVLMQPTSPCWDFKDLLWAMKKVQHENAPGMFSVNPAFKPNGCFYMARTRDFIEQHSLFLEGSYVYVMDWKESVDIDNLWDFRVAQAELDGRVLRK